MLLLRTITLALATFGDRQGVATTLHDATPSVLVVVRAYGGRDRSALMRALAKTPFPTAVCGDVGDGDFAPVFTKRASVLMHSTDDHLPEAYGDSPHHRRWKVALVVDVFGCLLAAQHRADIIVYVEDDVELLPRFTPYVQEFRASRADVWWGTKQMSAMAFLIRSTTIRPLYDAVESHWMIDPVDWLIWGMHHNHPYIPKRFDAIVKHRPKHRSTRDAVH